VTNVSAQSSRKRQLVVFKKLTTALVGTGLFGCKELVWKNKNKAINSLKVHKEVHGD
jgi:hypothetical protein